MTKTNLRLVFSVIMIVCINLISCGTPSHNPAPYETQFTLNSFANSIRGSAMSSDLDARDQYNRPIKTREAKEQLLSLFSSGLYSLLVCTEMHYSTELLAVIRRMLSGADNFFTRNPWGVCLKAVEGILFQTKKLAVFFTALLFVAVQLFLTNHISSHLFFTPEVKVAPLILRC